MNYTLSDLPNVQDSYVFMDIFLSQSLLGTIKIKLFRDVFPAGVDNFALIAKGSTYKEIPMGYRKKKFIKAVKRTFDDCRFFHFKYNNYIVSGDIYNNNGFNAGTIFNDEPIPSVFGDYYIPHDTKGLISLIPYYDETSQRLLYDSTFMITLDDVKPSNILRELDKDQIVIGNIISGIDILDKINKLIKPHAGRSYPKITIHNSKLNY